MERVGDILDQIGQGAEEQVASAAALVEDSGFSLVWAIGLAVIAYLAYRYFSKSSSAAPAGSNANEQREQE